jgi:hypothetical protein
MKVYVVVSENFYGDIAKHGCVFHSKVHAEDCRLIQIAKSHGKTDWIVLEKEVLESISCDSKTLEEGRKLLAGENLSSSED